MNMKSIKNLSAFAFGIIAGFAIDKYANAENVAKLKTKATDIYEKLSKKITDATEPKVEYVDDNEVMIDRELLDSCNRMTLRCKPYYAASLCEHIRLVVKTKGYITINDIVDLGWLADDTIYEIASKYTVDECALMGWGNNYDCGYSAGQDYMLISYPEELTDLIYDEEDDISVDTGSIMDTYQKWNENADVLRLTADEQEELTTSREVDAYKVLADIADKMEEDGFVSVATLMQVIYDVDKSFYKNMEPFADRFTNLNANYDEDTLINYGWTSMRYFNVFKIPNIESFMLANTSPHNIASLVEKWTEKNRKEFEEETKAE